MSKFLKKSYLPWNYICSALMILLIVLQFVPFWEYNGQSSSINGYIWLPSNRLALGNYLSSATRMNITPEVVSGPPIIQFISAIAGTIMCIVIPDFPLVGVFPIVCGISGICGYLLKPVFRLGIYWQLHFCIYIALTLFGIASLIRGLRCSQSGGIKN